MLYCSIVWSNTLTQNINKLQSIQNFASKIIMNSRKFDQVTPLLRQLNQLPVKKLLYYRDCVLTYKCLNGLAPKIFTKRSSIHVRHTRNRDLLYIPLYNTATGQRTFACRETGIWNNLDKDLKTKETSTFREQLLFKNLWIKKTSEIWQNYLAVKLCYDTEPDTTCDKNNMTFKLNRRCIIHSLLYPH